MAALLTRTSILPISRATPSTKPRAEPASARSAAKASCALKGGERLLGRLPVCAGVDRHPCTLLRALACYLAGDKPARRRVYLLFPAFGTMMVNPGSMTNARTDRTIAH
jgi:hypothetical protein